MVNADATKALLNNMVIVSFSVAEYSCSTNLNFRGMLFHINIPVMIQ